MKKMKCKTGRGKRPVMSKIVVGLLCFMMIMAYSLAPIPPMSDVAYAEDSDFTVEDGVITGYNGSDTDVVIPESIDGETIVGIGESAFDNTYSDIVDGDGIESVEIPATVTDIGEYAFYANGYLQKVTFKGDIPTIGYEAFSGSWFTITFCCDSSHESDLKSALDDSDIDDYEIETTGGSGETDPPAPASPFTINGSGVITGYELPDSLTGGTVANPKTGTVEIPATIDGVTVTGIAANAFYNKFAKTVSVDIKIPATVTYIGEHAFDTCWGIKKVEVAENSQLKTIGNSAFYNCAQMTDFQFPDSLELIDYSAFKNCYAFCGENGTVKIPANAEVKLVGGGQNEDPAFAMCSSIEKFEIAESNTSIMSDDDGVIFSKDGKQLILYPLGRSSESYEIPEGVETIVNGAFKVNQNDTNGAARLKNVAFPNSLKTVENNAFMCQGLTSVSMPADIDWGTGVFQLNKDLKTVTINEGITSIPDNFFYGLDNVTEINLPDTLKTIGYRAFDRCNVTEIDLPEGLETIGEEAFECSKLESVTIPASVTKIGDRAFYLSGNLTELNIENGKTALDLGKYTFNSCGDLNNVVIPERVTKLDDGIFSCCGSLTDIEMKAVTELGNCVFAYSGLKEMDLPDTITKIGNATFFTCTALEKVTLPASLEELGTCTFELCTGLTEVTIPDTVKFTTIPEDTFWACRELTSLSLPASVKETKACAFSYCENLADIEVENLENDFKRSLFDCYAINLDDDFSKYGYWVEGVFYLNDDAVELLGSEQDNSGGAIGEVDKVVEDGEALMAKADGAVLFADSAEGTEAVCGCSISGGGSYSATANPKFKYRTPASNTSAGSNSGKYVSSANGGAYADNYAGAPATGDDAYLMIFVLLALLSGVYILSCRNKAK